jgi:hypothetical protein
MFAPYVTRLLCENNLAGRCLTSPQRLFPEYLFFILLSFFKNILNILNIFLFWPIFPTE